MDSKKRRNRRRRGGGTRDPYRRCEDLCRGQWALKLDRQLRFFGRAHSLSLPAIGEGLLRLEETGGYMALGYSSRRDYLVQCLGLTESHGNELINLAKRLRKFPLLHQAFNEGKITYSQLRFLTRHATPDVEDRWAEWAPGRTLAETRTAMETYREILKAARQQRKADRQAARARRGTGSEAASADAAEAGGLDRADASGDGSEANERDRWEPGGLGHDGSEACDEQEERREAALEREEDEEHEKRLPPQRLIKASVPAHVALAFDVAHELVKRQLGYDASRAMAVECFMGEWMSGEGGVLAKQVLERREKEGLDQQELARRREAEQRQKNRLQYMSREEVRALEQDAALLNDYWSHLSWDVPKARLPESLDLGDVREAKVVHGRLKGLLKVMQRADCHAMKVLGVIHRWRLYDELDMASFEQYVEERSFMSLSLARSLVALDRKLLDAEGVREALRQGRITRSHAFLLVDIVDSSNEEAWIQHAEHTTVRHLEEDVKAASWMREFNPKEYYATGGQPREADAWKQRADEGASRKSRRSKASSEASASSPVSPLFPDLSWDDDEEDDSDEESRVQTCADESDDGQVQTCADDSAAAGYRPKSILAEIQDFIRRQEGDEKAWQPWMEQDTTLKFWLPRHLEESWDLVFSTVSQLYGGLPVTTRLVIETLVEHFLEQYAREAFTMAKRYPVFERDEWKCMVPNCTRRGEFHSHHLDFRSEGGGNEKANLITLCMVHHQYLVHRGVIIVRGRAPDELTWIIGIGGGEKPHMVIQGRRLVTDPKLLEWLTSPTALACLRAAMRWGEDDLPDGRAA